MAEITAEVDGLEAFLGRIRAIRDGLGQAIAASQHQWCEDTMSLSKGDRVPVAPDGGRLMNTGYVALPVVTDGVIESRMGYNTDYALFVHEALEGAQPPNPDWSWAKAAAKGHPINWTRPGSGPKYLEGPAKEREHLLLPQIQEAIDDLIRG